MLFFMVFLPIYTIGQRKGLGGGFPEPMFVLEIRPATREVVVGAQDELYQDEVTVQGLNWLAEAPDTGDELRFWGHNKDGVGSCTSWSTATSVR